MSSIVEFAHQAALQLAERLYGNPEAELMAWLVIARRREALVAVAYDQSYIDTHLARLSRIGVANDAIRAVKNALGSVWAQEEGHQAYLDAVLKAVVVPEGTLAKLDAFLQGLMGAIEGRIVAGIMSPSLLKQSKARLAIALGRLASEVPVFVENLRGEHFSEFCKDNSELEATAVLGYNRMLDLIDKIEGDNSLASSTTLRPDLLRTRTDEMFHQLLFQALSKVFGSDPPPPPSSPALQSTSSGYQNRSQAAVELAIRGALHQAYSLPPQQDAPGDAVIRVDLVRLAKDPLMMFLSSRGARIAASFREQDESASTGAVAYE